MLRFIARRRWELFLLLAVPFAGLVVFRTAFLLLNVVTVYLEASLLLDGHYYRALGPRAASNLTEAALLALAYWRVRQLGQPFLALVWRYMFAMVAVPGVVVLVGAPFFGDDDDIFGTLGLITAGSVLALPLLVWFVWRASRTSWLHAFFLLLLGGLAVGLPEASPSGVEEVLRDLVWRAVASAFTLAMAVLGAWLLGNFDEHGRAFRRRAVLGLLALAVFEAAIGYLSADLVWLAALGWLLMYAVVVYVLRFRNPGLGNEVERSQGVET